MKEKRGIKALRLGVGVDRGDKKNEEKRRKKSRSVGRTYISWSVIIQRPAVKLWPMARLQQK
jgi:hypothetical protein